MNHPRTVRRALLTGAAALTAVTLATLVAGCGDGDDTQPAASASAGGSASASASVATFNDSDVMFAQMMIVHHEQAVEMATLAETRATDPEVKQLAGQIKAAQSPEITTMTGWLTTWGEPVTMEGGMSHGSMPGEMSDADMAKLKAAEGKEFDKMFVQMMVEHHNGAIEMAKDEQRDGANQDAKALAAKIEQTQTAEVATLQTILTRL